MAEVRYNPHPHEDLHPEIELIWVLEGGLLLEIADSGLFAVEVLGALHLRGAEMHRVGRGLT